MSTAPRPKANLIWLIALLINIILANSIALAFTVDLLVN